MVLPPQKQTKKVPGIWRSAWGCRFFSQTSGLSTESLCSHLPGTLAMATPVSQTLTQPLSRPKPHTGAEEQRGESSPQ